MIRGRLFQFLPLECEHTFLLCETQIDIRLVWRPHFQQSQFIRLYVEVLRRLVASRTDAIDCFYQMTTSQHTVSFRESSQYTHLASDILVHGNENLSVRVPWPLSPLHYGDIHTRCSLSKTLLYRSSLRFPPNCTAPSSILS